jgi:hypothetical protein
MDKHKRNSEEIQRRIEEFPRSGLTRRDFRQRRGISVTGTSLNFCSLQ